MKSLAKKMALAGVGLAMVSGMAIAPRVSADASLDSTSVEMSKATPSGIEVATDAGGLLKTVITLVIVVAALLTLFYLVMGAISWITSGGDKGKVEEARNKITAAVIGYSYGIVGVNVNLDLGTISRQSLVNGVVHNLVYEVVQTCRRGRADVHTGTLSYRLKTL